MVLLQPDRINYNQAVIDRGPAGVELPPHVVLCVGYDDVGATSGHRHLRYLEAVDPGGMRMQWQLAQIVAAMRNGERFVAGGGGGRPATTLELGLCPVCPFITLRFAAADPDLATCD
jgi:hypothetical protein